MGGGAALGMALFVLGLLAWVGTKKITPEDEWACRPYDQEEEWK